MIGRRAHCACLSLKPPIGLWLLRYRVEVKKEGNSNLNYNKLSTSVQPTNSTSISHFACCLWGKTLCTCFLKTGSSNIQSVSPSLLLKPPSFSPVNFSHRGIGKCVFTNFSIPSVDLKSPAKDITTYYWVKKAKDKSGQRVKPNKGSFTQKCLKWGGNFSFGLYFFREKGVSWETNPPLFPPLDYNQSVLTWCDGTCWRAKRQERKHDESKKQPDIICCLENKNLGKSYTRNLA